MDVQKGKITSKQYTSMIILILFYVWFILLNVFLIVFFKVDTSGWVFT